MFPHNNHNRFMPQAPPPPHFPTSTLADVGSNGRGGGVGNSLGMGIGNIAPVNGMGQIDWAQLAQQWIHMRDQTVTTATTTPGPPAPPNFGIIPLAPPPPIINNVPEYQRQQSSNLHYEEHGEADMDMDDDTERGHGIDMQISTPTPMPPVVSNQISQSDSNAAAPGRNKQQQEQQWTNWPGQSNKQAINNPTAHIPSLLKLNVSNPNEPHGLGHHHQSLPSQHPQQQLPSQNQQQQQQQQQSEVSNMGGSANEIDTNKRKMLPAWIREGLEKMEREKQRQLEREQPITSANLDLDLFGSSTDPENHHHQQQGQNVKQVSSKTLTTPVNIMNLTNVASDSEDSHEELSGNAPASAQLNKGKDMLIRRTTRRRSDSQSTEHTQDNNNEEHEEEELPPRSEIRNEAIATIQARQVHDNSKNYEERLADLMMVVRRTLTEILLETTNEEIAIIANETMKAHRAKASSAQVIRKSALSSITGNLGLAAYGDSSSESERDDDDDDDDGHKASDDDDRTGNTTSTDSGKLSAEELKARIRRSKRSFENVIIDIEHRVAQQEQRDELVLEKQRKLEMERMTERRKESGSQNREPIGESLTLGSSNDKIKQFNGKRPSRKERTTRFSDNKDVKQSNQSFVQHVLVAAASSPASMPTTTSSSSTAVPSKIKAIPNVATNLLQMPESVATMLSAADKALQKANKSSDRKPKRRRRSTTTSSSSSSSGSGSGSSTSSSSTSSSSDSSTSDTTKSSSSRSVNSKKKNTSSISKSRQTPASSSSSSRRHHHHHHQRDQDEGSSSRSRSRNKYDRREHDRERERRHHYGGSSSNTHRRRPNKRDSSHSGDEHRDKRHRSSRHGDYAKDKRHHTRSRSRSRSRNSQHHQHYSTVSHSSSSSASHHRKRV